MSWIYLKLEIALLDVALTSLDLIVATFNPNGDFSFGHVGNDHHSILSQLICLLILEGSERLDLRLMGSILV